MRSRSAQQQVDERERAADERERIADERERIADERDRAADERDRAADERERIADQREITAAMSAADWPLDTVKGDWLPDLTATGAALQRRLASLATDVARVFDERAETLDRRARWDVSSAVELHAQAVAARRFAQSERQAALRFANA